MKKRMLAIWLPVCMLAIMVPTSLAASPAGDIAARLQQISSTSPYQNASYTAFNGQGLGSGCYAFINAVSRQLFGVGIPSQASATSLDASSNWTCVGSAGADNSAARNLLGSAQAGDIFQYKNSYTNPYHIAMVYDTSSSGIAVYDNTSSSGARIRSYAWDNLSGLGDFSAAGSGISLYRCTQNVLTTPVGSTGGTAVSVVVTTGAAEDLTETSATLHGSVQSSVKVSEVGMYLGESSASMTKLGSDAVNGTAPNMWYNTAKYGRTLVSGRIYFYQAYAVVNGQTYWGEVKTFMPDLLLTMELSFADSSAYDLPDMQVDKPIEPIDVSGGVSGGTKPYTFSADGLPYGIEISADGIISGTPFLITVPEPATITVRDAAGNEKSITIDCGRLFAAPAFAIDIDYANETIAVKTGMQWTEDPAGGSGLITAMWDDELPIDEPGSASYFLSFGNTLYFRVDEQDGWTRVEIPARPAAPSGVSGGAGKITGVSRLLEYSADGQRWTDCSGSTVQNLAAGTYQVRVKAKTNAFASEAVSVQVTAAAAAVDWKSVYRKLVQEQVEDDGSTSFPSTYTLQDLNGDGVPELLIVGPYEAQGDRLYTVRSDGSTTYTIISQGDFMYDAANQLIWAPFGHMDLYQDIIYRLENGSFVQEHEGRYGLWNSSNISGSAADYTYEWDGEMVTEQQYQALLEAAVDTDGAVNLSSKAVSAQTVLAQLGAGETTSTGFADVPSSAWFAEAVRYVQEEGMMQGTSGTLFSPEDTTTRAMLVTILYRMENEPKVGGNDFADVPSNAYYADAVAWASQSRIVTGTESNRFSPNDPVTREQMAAILYRYAGYKYYDVATGSSSLGGFSDASQVSAYAQTAMQWALQKGLVTGVSSTELDPQGTATRAQVATILMRFDTQLA